MKIAFLKNPIQEYAWGSRSFIPELLGDPVPAETPKAELWMGAHPRSPSMVKWDNQWISLEDLIRDRPDDILGEKVAERFNGRLPFLFKLLAAAKPLSIQAHPGLEQAKSGFERENRRHIPLDSPHRNYRDDNHKPELICALRPFWALKGFRKIDEMIDYLEILKVSLLKPQISALRQEPGPDGLKAFFSSLMAMEREKQHIAVSEAAAAAKKHEGDDPVLSWVARLHQAYPGDIGVLSPLILNAVLLKPGEGMVLPAGELHAYLEGVGIELMANSDNVIRGGLTPKHMDVHELLEIVNFTPAELKILKPQIGDAVERIYVTGTEEFQLSVIIMKPGTHFESSRRRAVEIIICTEGTAKITDQSAGDTMMLRKGQSILIPASVSQYRMQGEATMYKATVPMQ